MTELKHPYISVKRNSKLSYGGSQNWSDSRVISRCGCGVIGCADVLIYLSRYHLECKNNDFPAELLGENIDIEAYNQYLTKLNRRYLPIIPPFGINGFALSVGLELAFRYYKIPMRARWGVHSGELFKTIDRMLSEDIPVILSVGPNFPRVWQKKNATLYTMRSGEHPRASASTHAHFLTVTGMDEEWLQVSSWGRKYYISREEYADYVRLNSNQLLSSIVNISKT